MLPIVCKIPSTYILDRGESFGFEWIVLNNGIGHRCGYIKIPQGHPFWKQGCSTPISVHGGVTYFDDDTEDNSTWVGFDCGHSPYDLVDPDLPVSSIGDDYPVLMCILLLLKVRLYRQLSLVVVSLVERQSIRKQLRDSLLEFQNDLFTKRFFDQSEMYIKDTDYVKTECKDVCEQLAEATRAVKRYY